MKTLMTIKELVKQGFSKEWLYRIVHSEDFVLAGGIREPVPKSAIRFDPEKLQRYMEQQTLLSL